MTYRDREEIFVSILNTVGTDGARKTKIMYSSFLSYHMLVEYLDVLTNNGFLEYEKISRIYKVTPKGFRFLELQEKVNSILTEGLEIAGREDYL
jgi:predicted transcriptional regulator